MFNSELHNNNNPTKDHLGNNRMVVHQSGSVDQVNNYYPYGGLMANSTGWNAQRYKYNGKEFDRMHGLDWYDYGARNYDAVIGQFTTKDPLCEKYYHISPYAYCENNPLRFIDPDGRTIWVYYYDENGKQQGFEYSIGMECEVQNLDAQTIVNNLNLMCKNYDGYSVINSLLESDTQYGYMRADTHNDGGEGFYNSKNNTIYLNDPGDTMAFAEETFHGFQYCMGQGGLTAVNEVEAKLFSSKMNFEIDSWQQNGRFNNNLCGIEGTCYSDSMTNLFYVGFNPTDYRNAVNSFFVGKLSGNVYKNLGYTLGTIISKPLIEGFLPVK